LKYDVYLDTISNPMTAISTNKTTTSITRSGLKYNTTYYWKIVAKDSNETTGPTWSFTTSGEFSPNVVEIAGGTFTAGTSSVIINSFKIDNYEVTYDLWTEVRNWGLSNGYTDLPAGGNGYNPVGSKNPVTEINWYDIVKWCNARSEKDGLSPVYYTNGTQDTVYRTGQININIDAVKWTANGYRLPTECEWEFAARGGTQNHGYTYSGSNTIDDVAWYYSSNSNSTHSVGQKSANELGIYDMSGNVWEWCWDWYGSTYPSGGTTDPKGPSTTQTYRLLRGGSFYTGESNCRVASRNYADYGYGNPNNRGSTYGFRCVQD
jgi:formylglycine-generating enzyme required for sulfatase activity